MNKARNAAKTAAPLTTKLANAALPPPIDPKIVTTKQGLKGTQQQVLEDVAKKSSALRTAGAAAKTVGRVTQVGSVAAMALEDSPAVTGQPVSTLLDPHLPDQVSSESRYFTELFKYWVGLRDTEPKLPAHMRYQPNPPAE